jgi:hypothetical protein
MKLKIYGSLICVLIQLSVFGASHLSSINHASGKIPLKVLYVGYNPDRPMPANVVYYSTVTSEIEKAYKTRMADFKAFLNSRFSSVTLIDARDYDSSMSEQADVTIMDAGPVKLPENFDRPMVLMHAMAPNIGLPIGLKFDLYCQCLEDDALNINTKHEIFNVPNKVNLTLVKKPTPGSFYNGFQGAKTPKEMLMWNVVKESASANGKYIIGMVSHGEGFNDSPDAESISGGVCLKNAEAVALGRQGNYFMWGFSGAPNYMTDEAKDVFVNAICYIKKYDHRPAIVKKVQIETREFIDERIYRIDKDLYEKAIVSRREGNIRMLKMQQDLKDKKAAGEDIGKGNEMFLKMPVTNEVESFEDYLKGQAGEELFKQFGTNTALYHKYYKDNYEFFYPSDAYSMMLDVDAQTLGISNRKVEILEKCIQLLEQNKDVTLAQRVLERYTTEKFKTAAEWRDWLNKNKSSLFYTEAGGFKFMVNTYEKRAEVIRDVIQPTIADPVSVSAHLVYAIHRSHADLVIDAVLLKGWHIYAFVPKDSPFIPSEVIMELPKGVTALKDPQTTAAKPLIGNEGVFVFEDKVTFRIPISLTAVKPGSVISCGLYYQTCDENKCLQPTRKVIQIKI